MLKYAACCVFPLLAWIPEINKSERHPVFSWGGAWALSIMHYFIVWDIDKPAVPKPDLKYSWGCGWIPGIVCNPGKVVPRLCHKVHFAVRNNNTLQRGIPLVVHRTASGSFFSEIADYRRDGITAPAKESPLQRSGEMMEFVLHTGLFACESSDFLCL